MSNIAVHGLRESELAALNINQYYNRGLHNVKRKGKKVTKKVPVQQEARNQMMNLYLLPGTGIGFRFVIFIELASVF